MRTGDRAPDIELLRLDGTPASLAALAAGRPLVLFFLRHYGCIACHDRVEELRARRADYERRAAAVYCVTNGKPEHSAEFCARREVPFPCVVDRPGEPAYRAFDLEKVNYRRLFGPSLVEAFAIIARRWREIETPKSGDVLQMSGTMVLDRDGVVRLAHHSYYPNDHAADDDVLALLDTLA